MENDTGNLKLSKLTIAEKSQRLLLLAERRKSADAVTGSWEIIRDLGVSDVRGMLHELEARNKDADGNWQMGMLYFRWAQLDPTAALQAATTDHQGNFANDALGAWMKANPDAAFRWAESSEKFNEEQPQAAWMAKFLADLPPSEALAKARAYSEKTRAATLKLISQNQAETPEGREAFLAEIVRGDLPEAEKTAAMNSFFKSWGARDAVAALDQVATLSIASKQQTELHQQILGTWGRNHPEAALTWMIGKSDALPVPKQLIHFRQWTQAAPQQAAAWLDRQSPEVRLQFKLTPR